MHISEGKNYFIDLGFTTVGYPQIVYVFDNIDYEPLKMDIYKLQVHSEFADIAYGDDCKEIIVYMNVPKKFRTDFDKFLQGKYSEFSEEYKQLLVKKYGEGRQTGINPKNKLPNVSVYDAICPGVDQIKLLADCLSARGSRVDWRDIKEIVSSIDIDVEKFKTIEELEEEYGIK